MSSGGRIAKLVALTTTKWVAGVAAFAAISVGGGIVASAMVLPGVVVFQGATETATEMFDALPVELGSEEVAQSSRIYSADGRILATYYEENRRVVPLDEVSQAMQDAVVALEDKRFGEHGGIDIAGMARAAVNNLDSDSGRQGGSTLAQQSVKNVLVERAVSTGDVEEVRKATEPTISRKLREAKLAIALEKNIGKDKILEGYLNIAQFGASLYGVEAAAMYYFGGIHAKDLNIVQAATIAAIANAPNAYDPSLHPEANQKRRDAALATMLNEGYITRAEYDEAKAQSVASTLDITEVTTGCAGANKLSGSAYYCDYVVSVIRNSPEFGETQEERMRLLKRGGLEIYTTLDRKVQKQALNSILDTIPKRDPSGVGIALSAVEPGTGRILAMVQNRDYSVGETTKKRETSVNWNTDKDSGGSSGFQSGSTFKPFVLADWLNEGHSLGEQFAAMKSDYSNSDWKAVGCREGDSIHAGGEWKVANSTSGQATMNAVGATANSVNTAYVAMEAKLDMCKIQKMLDKMGIHRADGNDWQLVPSMVLGSNEIAPLTMAAGYAAFASGGIYCKPVAITEVRDAAGKTLPIPEADCKRAMKAEVAAGVSAALQAVMTQGTGVNRKIPDGRPQAGKTGTTDSNVAVWFCGYTPQVATAVWAGYPTESKPLRDMSINGEYFYRAFGGLLPGKAWQAFMTAYLEDKEPIAFPEVSVEIQKGAQVTVPNVIGLTMKGATGVAYSEGFTVSEGSREYSDTVPEGEIIAQSPGSGAKVYLDSSRISVVISRGPDPGRESDNPLEEDFGLGADDDGDSDDEDMPPDDEEPEENLGRPRTEQ
ncbi:MAG: penicillin-binding protein [Bifidobacteriaceae bacterium]|jgi:membrane peptidoglycan carboxypeptidase|nr:penicillin-binding protein [Bifidobacteriaceae bacterium]